MLSRFDVGWFLLLPTQRCWGQDAHGLWHKLFGPTPSGWSFGSSFLVVAKPPPLQRPGVGALPGSKVLAGFGGTQACLTAARAVMGHEHPVSRLSLSVDAAAAGGSLVFSTSSALGIVCPPWLLASSSF